MSEVTATRTSVFWRTATIIVLAAAWIVAAALLWRTVIPRSLDFPKLDPQDYFSPADLGRAQRYERFVRINLLLEIAASIVVLLFFIRRAPRLARGTALGPIGAGLVVGAVMLVLLWAVDLPFVIASAWWEDRHDLSRQSWLYTLLAPLIAPGGLFFGLFMLEIVIFMGFARRFPRHWWLPVTLAFLAVSVVFVAVDPYIEAYRVHGPRNPELRRDIETLKKREHVEGTAVDVEKVSDVTSQANAFATGVGPTTRVVLWDTLLDRRFSSGEVRTVVAHEFGHVARRHLWKGLGWFVLFSLPLLYVTAQVTRRRGGLGDPGVLPYGILVLTLLGLATSPADNLVSRRYEAEADWMALRTTRDPESAKGLFEKFNRTSLAQPDPPTWSYLFLDTHPTLMQRIAMAEAWKRDYASR